MPDPLSTTPTIHSTNIAGAPLTTVSGIILGVGQYLAGQGGALPHDGMGWLQLVLGLLMIVGGAFLKSPGQ